MIACEKHTFKFLTLLVTVCLLFGYNGLIAQSFKQPIILHKDSVLKILHRYRFNRYYVEAHYPAKFYQKKTRSYRVPQDEKVLAYIDASILSNCKYGIVIGTRGLYVYNSNTSSAPGAKFISYGTLREHDLLRIDQNELIVETTPIEVYGLSEDEQMEVKALVRDIKTNLLIPYFPEGK